MQRPAIFQKTKINSLILDKEISYGQQRMKPGSWLSTQWLSHHSTHRCEHKDPSLTPLPVALNRLDTLPG